MICPPGELPSSVGGLPFSESSRQRVHAVHSGCGESSRAPPSRRVGIDIGGLPRQGPGLGLVGRTNPVRKFLCAIFDEWVRNDVGKYFVQIFDVSLEIWLGWEPSLCVFKRTCGQALALEHNGDLYSCDHFVYPENKLGNIMEQPLGSLVASPQQSKFGGDKRDRLPQYCRTCDVRFACNGECPKHRFVSTPDGQAGLNYLCAGYKLFFRHIDPYMRFMAGELREGRAPANVMSWVPREFVQPGRTKTRSPGLSESNQQLAMPCQDALRLPSTE
jgi:radical SAM protein with 4Fe4S-binding SPASM domain